MKRGSIVVGVLLSNTNCNLMWPHFLGFRVLLRSEN
jgi:hypothetical protein